MCKLFNDYQEQIKAYCVANKLDFEKARTSPKCYSKNSIWLQHCDPTEGQRGLLDETPAPVILKISKNGDHLEFEQTEHTRKFLA